MTTRNIGASDYPARVEETGPFLQAALVCEKVLREQDGVISMIRTIDRCVFVVGPEGEPLNPHLVLFFVIIFKSGTARGSYPIRIEREEPDTTRSTVVATDAFFEGEDRGVNIVIQGDFSPRLQGLYWYDVFFNDKRITRMPLRAIYQTPPSAAPPG